MLSALRCWLQRKDIIPAGTLRSTGASKHPQFQEADTPEVLTSILKNASAESAGDVPACSIDLIRATSRCSACTPAIESNAVQARLCDQRSSSTSILDLSA